ncbi:MAG: PrsW family intramembrane metalloprotease [Armatimonadetes bacterium]|nr:PrsW family intramembrane metalloprotease [Armatimonadota bacterium]
MSSLASRAGSGRALWYAQAASFTGLLLYVGVLRRLTPWLRFEPDSAALVVAALVLALIPSLLWLVFFWAVDRREPEPMGHVAQVFLLGALLSQAVVLPVTRDIFQVRQWLGGDLLTHLLGSILVVGAAETFANYAAVRYSVFNSDELGSVMDGVVYGTAAGLGVAAVFNFGFVIEARGLPTTAAVLQVVITALAHAALGMVIGYFLGRAKVDRSAGALVAGVAVAAVLNGVFDVLLETVVQAGLVYRPWYGLLAALSLAVMVSAVIFAAVARAPATSSA